MLFMEYFGYIIINVGFLIMIFIVLLFCLMVIDFYVIVFKDDWSIVIYGWLDCECFILGKCFVLGEVGDEIVKLVYELLG